MFTKINPTKTYILISKIGKNSNENYNYVTGGRIQKVEATNIKQSNKNNCLTKQNEPP